MTTPVGSTRAGPTTWSAFETGLGVTQPKAGEPIATATRARAGLIDAPPNQTLELATPGPRLIAASDLNAQRAAALSQRTQLLDGELRQGPVAGASDGRIIKIVGRVGDSVPPRYRYEDPSRPGQTFTAEMRLDGMLAGEGGASISPLVLRGTPAQVRMERDGAEDSTHYVVATGRVPGSWPPAYTYSDSAVNGQGTLQVDAQGRLVAGNYHSVDVRPSGPLPQPLDADIQAWTRHWRSL